MVEIHHEAYCAAPLEVAFGYVDDYRTATNWMFGLTSFEPVGETSHGLGAVFDATFAVKPVKLSSVIEVTEWVRDQVVAFDSVDGFSNDSVWRFSAAGPTRTKIEIRFRYQLPGGVGGRVLGKALGPIAALGIRHTDEALCRGIERRFAQL
jgi:uncharacterized membrane protein